jgi:hypothetical protein
MWDVGSGPSEKTVFKPKSRVAADVAHVKEPSLINAINAQHRPKFAALSPVKVTATG